MLFRKFIVLSVFFLIYCFHISCLKRVFKRSPSTFMTQKYSITPLDANNDNYNNNNDDNENRINTNIVNDNDGHINSVKNMINMETNIETTILTTTTSISSVSDDSIMSSSASTSTNNKNIAKDINVDTDIDVSSSSSLSSSDSNNNDNNDNVDNDDNNDNNDDNDDNDYNQQQQPYDNITDDDMDFILKYALGETHRAELSKKVEESMQQELDYSQGVEIQPRKPLPLKVNLDLWNYYAKKEFNSGDFTEAMRLYQKCVDYNPVDGRAWLGMARIYWKKGKAKEAELSYKDGLYYNPRNPYLMQSWAVMLEKQGNIRRAKKMLTESVRANPSHAASWVALARINQREGSLSAARDCYSMAVDADPKAYVALQAWGVLESEDGNVRIARELYRRSWEASKKKSSHALQAWATLEKRMGNYEEATELLNKALEAYSSNSKVRLSLAEIYEERGEIEKARICFKEGEKYAERRGDAGYFQAWALFELRVSGVVDAQRRLGRERRAASRININSWNTDTNINTNEITLEDVDEVIDSVAQVIDNNGSQIIGNSFSSTSSNNYDTNDDALPFLDTDNDKKSHGKEKKMHVITKEEESNKGIEIDMESELERRGNITSININTETEMEVFGDYFTAQEFEDYLTPPQLDAQKIARRLFRRAVKVNKQHSASWVAWAKHEQFSGHPDVARRLLITGISKFPNSKNIGWFHCSLGHLSRQQGDINTARACYDRALAATPTYRSLSVILEYARMETYHGSYQNSRDLHELAVRRFGSGNNAAIVWDSYMELERRQSMRLAPVQRTTLDDENSYGDSDIDISLTPTDFSQLTAATTTTTTTTSTSLDDTIINEKKDAVEKSSSTTTTATRSGSINPEWEQAGFVNLSPALAELQRRRDAAMRHRDEKEKEAEESLRSMALESESEEDINFDDNYFQS